MDEVISASFFEWIEENEGSIDYSVMFESCESSILTFSIEEKRVVLNLKSNKATTTSKDNIIKKWVDSINLYFAEKKPLSTQSQILEFFGKIFADYTDLKEYASEDEEASSEENYHEEIVEASTVPCNWRKSS